MSLDAGDDVRGIGVLFRELSLKEMRLRPYVEPLFDRLHRSGVKLGIVSNTEAVLTRFELDRYPVLRTAETMVLSSDVGVQKPDPRIFHLALDRLGAEPTTTVFVGNDWTADILGARRVGLKAIYVKDQRAEVPRPAAGESDVLEVAATLGALALALRMHGWQESDG
jgi:putative hydrolase of the HAD superfamily